MPEGDTIFRTAQTLDRALGRQVVTRFASVLPPLTRVDEDAPIAGRLVERVWSQGKHLLIVFSGGLVLRTLPLRRTTGRAHPEARLWVYGRAGRACRRCGAPIHRRKQGPDARSTYWCPQCQAPVSVES
ncbi:MAG TPA: zinc finger domain-containing protein [Vicinamibacterales bacterium]|nr:zinc finger domain-containing protein [Vicinamibacterales bacterium]